MDRRSALPVRGGAPTVTRPDCCHHRETEMLSIEEVRALYGDDDRAHDFDHVLRVLTLAERIAMAEGADMAIIRAATLLHDIAHREPQHHLAGAARARDILAGHDPDFVGAVVHAIQAHRFRCSPDPATPEAQVLFDSDKLDAIGAVGIARAFAHSAHLGQPLFVTLSEAERHTATAGSPYTAVHEYVVKLSRLKDLLYTRTAREIARGRHEFMVAFFDRLDAELLGTD
jgi:uncharacterized protein